MVWWIVSARGVMQPVGGCRQAKFVESDERGFDGSGGLWMEQERRSDAKRSRRGITGEYGIGLRCWSCGSRRRGDGYHWGAIEELKAVALGWSVKKQVMDKDVYNDTNEKVGKSEDLIVAPDKAVSYAIVGVGGFLGIDWHDVAIPAGQLELEGNKLTLPGATKEALKALPKFEYAK